MLFERWTGAKDLKRWMPKFYWNVIWMMNWKYQSAIGKEGSNFRVLTQNKKKDPDTTQLTSSSFSDPLWFVSFSWWPLFSLFSRALCISFRLCSAPMDIRLFTERLFLFSFAFLSSYSAYFCVLSSSLYAFYFLLSFSHFVSFFPTYFNSKLFLHDHIQ